METPEGFIREGLKNSLRFIFNNPFENKKMWNGWKFLRFFFEPFPYNYLFEGMTVKLNVRKLAQEIVSCAIAECWVLCQMVIYKISTELLNVSKTKIMFCRRRISRS